MIHAFHTSFVAKIEKLVQKSRDTMTKSRKILLQKSMTSFDLHGLMRPGSIKVTYVHPPLVPFAKLLASARRGAPNFE